MPPSPDSHKIFDPQAIVNSHNAHKQSLALQHPGWTPERVSKQALIDTNTGAYQNQLISYRAHKNEDKFSYVNQQYLPVNGDWVDSYFGSLQDMIENEPTDFGKATLNNLRQAGFEAKTGEIVVVADTSGLGFGKEIKFLDMLIKMADGSLKNIQRLDLTGDRPDLRIDLSKSFFSTLGKGDGRQLIADKDKDSLGVLVLPQGTNISDFNQEIEVQVNQLWAVPEIPAIIPEQYPQFQLLPEIQFTKPTTSESLVPITSFAAKPAETVLKPEIRLSIPATTDFWFEVMTAAAPTITETQAPEYVIENTSGSEPEVLEIQETDEIVPTRTDPVGLSETKRVASASMNPVGVQEVELPSGFHLEDPKTAELVPTKIVFVGPKSGEPVIQKKETPVPVYIVVPKWEDQPTGTVLVGKQSHPGIRGASGATIKPTRSHLEGRVLYQRKQSREIVSRLHGGTEAILPPLWQVKLEPLNDKEIPFWQPGFNDFEINDALVLVVVTMFFLIANTVWRQPEQTFFNSRGSVDSRQRAVMALS